MDIARAVAPEIDRLVLGANGRTVSVHSSRLGPVLDAAGLDGVEFIPHLGDFMLAGVLTRDLATLRLRYAPPDRVVGWLDDLADRHFLGQSDSGLVAGPELGTAVEEWRAAVADVLADLWHGRGDEVAVATATANEVASFATDDHLVAVVHRQLPVSRDPLLALYDRLVTLRFVRQHDHAEAWLAHGLTPTDMSILTPLWLGEEVEASGDGLSRLIQAGYVQGEPLRLTTAGMNLREDIEIETNRRAQVSFDVLDEAVAAEFLAILRLLPGKVD